MSTLLLIGPPLVFIIIGEIIRLMLRRLVTEPLDVQFLGSGIDALWSEEPAASLAPVPERAAA